MLPIATVGAGPIDDPGRSTHFEGEPVMENTKERFAPDLETSGVQSKEPSDVTASQPARRRLFKTAAAAAVGVAATAPGPFIRTAAAAGTTWKVQTSWPAGVGLQTFKNWCGTIKEKTGGELEFKPFAAKEVVGDFELLDG
ncbi:MAG: hypothetical protein ACM3PU_11170, partial [Gemmatimonadota bacterium]